MAGHHHREGFVMVPTSWRRRLQRWLLALTGTLFLLLCALLFWAWAMLRAAPDEWSAPVRLGPWTVQASVPALFRVGTHPLTLKVLTPWAQGRALHTRWGVLRWQEMPDNSAWQLQCQPCVLRIPALGPQPLALQSVQVSGRRQGQSQLQGAVVIEAAGVAGGPSSAPVTGRWSLHMHNTHADVTLNLPITQLHDVAGLWAAHLPEWPMVQIQGQMKLDVAWQFPRNIGRIAPVLQGFEVSGLNTEALRTAEPTCQGAIPPQGWGPWLPRAVLAAEDQRFMEHNGFDLAALQNAWRANQGDSTGLHGGSTLSQQLAKMIYTGDQRHAPRKLRELLYAVELDRTLGKARVLDLYLAMAPWGQGQCGAVAAAKHYFKKPVHRLTPTEAAWLASLLHGPSIEVSRWAANDPKRTERTAWVLQHLRPLPAKQRAALVNELPNWTGPRLRVVHSVPSR
ncbi:MAG: transglycosylase domain-containing protein [Rhizobacter sp.]